MKRNFGGQQGPRRADRRERRAQRARASPAPTGCRTSPRTRRGSVANASRETPRRTGRHSASAGGSKKRSSTLRAPSVTLEVPRSSKSASQARNAGTVGGIDRARNQAQLRGEHLLLVEPLTTCVVERADGELLEQQRRVDQAGVDVEQQVGIEGVVGLARDGIDAVDPRVHLVDLVGGRVRLGLRAERHRVGQDQRPLQPLPRVALVHAGLVRAGDHQRVRRLHQQRARATEQAP